MFVYVNSDNVHIVCEDINDIPREDKKTRKAFAQYQKMLRKEARYMSKEELEERRQGEDMIRKLMSNYPEVFRKMASSFEQQKGWTK